MIRNCFVLRTCLLVYFYFFIFFRSSVKVVNYSERKSFSQNSLRSQRIAKQTRKVSSDITYINGRGGTSRTHTGGEGGVGGEGGQNRLEIIDD